jgi:hypothetical protein
MAKFQNCTVSSVTSTLQALGNEMISVTLCNLSSVVDCLCDGEQHLWGAITLVTKVHPESMLHMFVSRSRVLLGFALQNH